MHILGVSAFYHDSSACLMRDGEIIAAAQEERFTRKKHDFGFPENAVQYCLDFAGIGSEGLDHVVFYDKPFIKFERLLLTYMQFAPAGLPSFLQAMPLWLRQKLWLSDIISRETGFKGKVLFCDHHESHAASAFYPSPFEEAAIITADGVGEWASTSIATGHGNRLKMVAEMRFPHSLGLLYSAFTYYTGFRVNSGEYKLMGLAPYGEPVYVDIIRKELVDIRDDGSFRMNMKYFNYCVGLTMTNRRFDSLFGEPLRKPESPITQIHMDIARSIQVVTEEIMLKIARHAKKITGMKNLCLAGGVALNCVANGLILREKIFDNIWIQPASGDAGGALGAAVAIWHRYLDKPRAPRQRDMQSASYLGPEFTGDDIRSRLDSLGAVYEYIPTEEIPARVASLINNEKVIGWFQGRMEFGPRALGGRSIIGDPRSEKMQTVMNLKIKFRESFRPFAPSIIAERVSDYFELETESPYMLLVAPVRQEKRRPIPESEKGKSGLAKLQINRSEVPAITHVDFSARVQTVKREDNPLYYDTMAAFEKLTGCPLIINTSFNVRGEPIVCTPENAFTCFMRTDIDYLIVGNYLMDKVTQKAFEEKEDWRKEFVLD